MLIRGKWIILLVLLGVLLISPAISEEPTPAPKRAPRVDELYDKNASAGLPMRMPGEVFLADSEIAFIKENGKAERSPILDIAFSMLEKGNPFTQRYNIITGSDVEPMLEYGIPYFFGGQSMRYVLSRVPDYRTWVAWQDSKIYYRKDMRYFLGLDCRGFIECVLELAGQKDYTISSDPYKDSKERKVFSDIQPGAEEWNKRSGQIRTGDVIVIYHPGIHLMFYVGTLRDYGYTMEDFPEDSSVLDYPLVIHCGVNAVYADWFAYVKSQNPKEYRWTTVPDGGVTVALLGYENEYTINTLTQQRQETSWVLMPDKTWLTIIPWQGVRYWDVYR